MASFKDGHSNGAPPPNRRKTFISGLDSIQPLGNGNLEFVLYVMETTDGESVKRLLDESIVMHIGALPDAVGKALMALGRQVLVSENGSVTVMH